MSHLGEFDLIERIAASCHPEASFCHPERSEGSGIVGIGDDCAVIPQHDGLDTLVTTDLLIEDRHFLLSDISPEELGWKSAAVNISDIAAMGGKPTSAFLSIALPPSLSHPDAPSCHLEPLFCHLERAKRVERSSSPLANWVDRYIFGFNALCSRFGVALLGGDTSASDDKLFINVTMLGECPHGQAVMRSEARPGDLVCVSGPLGDSAAGLKLVLGRVSPRQQDPPSQVCSGVLNDAPLSEKKAENSLKGAGGCTVEQGLTPEDLLIRRHYLPVPRVELGQQLAALPGVHAMMDISDGIASDLRHILKASSGPCSSAETEEPATSILASAPLRPREFEGDAPSTVNCCRESGNAGPSSPSPDSQGHDHLHQRSSNAGGAPSIMLSAEIDLKALPMSDELRKVCAGRGWDPVELAVSGGEDYELLFTVAPGTPLPEGCTVIGRIVDLPPCRSLSLASLGSGSEPGMREPVIRWIGSEKEYHGFTHF